MIYDINPFPAVRSNKNSWSDSVQNYHSKMDYLRLLVNNRDDVIKALISWNYDLIFHIPIPKSWSKKKKAEMNHCFHQVKPDIDNLFKAFTDTVFYQTEYNDSSIHTIRSRKVRSDEWFIEFNIL